MQILTGGRHCQFAMFYALGANEAVGNFPDIAAPALHHENLQTVMAVEMYMKRGDNGLMKLVLEIGEGFCKIANMVVVNQRNGAHGKLVTFFPFALYQVVANQIADGFRPVHISFAGDQLVELLQEPGVNGDTKSGDIGHRVFPGLQKIALSATVLKKSNT